MDRIEKKENRAELFLKKMWEWLESEGQEVNGVKILTKADIEMKQTAARILAKGYIREKGPMEKDSAPPIVIEGLGEQIQNLTGDAPVVAETDPKKVV